MPIGTHTIERILHFLNEVKTVADITDPNIVHDHEGGGYTIGEEVAQRILDKRNSLPARRFVAIKELTDGVPGFGDDKLKDLAHSIAIPAAKYFRGKMYDGVIFDNWELNHHTFHFDDRADFFDLVQNEWRFTAWLGEQVEQIALQKFDNPKAARLANLLLQRCPLETYPDSHYGSFVFAFWFYQFDADNWFSFEKVRSVIEDYLSYYIKNHHRLEFRLFKGFENSGLLANPVTRPDLPVVVNYGEQELSIWTAQLND
jgi:hypothetical protein